VTFVADIGDRLPDRIGYAVIDGIADPIAWSGKHFPPLSWFKASL
jgi:hypothetical protein